MSVIALLAVVLAFVALSRTGKKGDLARRLEALEAELGSLRQALARQGGVGETALGESAPAERVHAEAPLHAARDSISGAAPEGTPARDADGFADARPVVGSEVTLSTELPASAGGTAAGGPLGQPAGLESAVRGSPASEGTAAPPPPSSGERARPVGGGGDSSPGVDWERWLGVRGAAVLGGAVLALAGLFFFRYSIEHGLIAPWLRVVLGAATGTGAIVAAEWGLRRQYGGTANAVVGGGLVVLYASFWAAGALYGLVPSGALFVMLVAVTVACCALSWRHDSLVIAVIGLAGGFLTPLFASSGGDRPIGLFGYILLLDVGLLLIARRKRWPVLAALALAGTCLYQLLWIAERMGPDRAVLGLAILALFALVFALGVPRDGAAMGAPSAIWRWSRRAGVLLPFVFGFYFAVNADLHLGILPLAAFLALLGGAAAWLASSGSEPRLATGAAAASFAVLAVWMMQNSSLGGAPWTASLALTLVPAAYHVVLELGRRRLLTPPAERELTRAAAGAGLGAMALLVGPASSWSMPLWPLLAGWLAIAGLLVRQADLGQAGRVQAATALVLAVGVAVYRSQHSLETALSVPGVTPPASVLAVMVVLAIAWQALALARARRAGPHAGAVDGWGADPSAGEEPVASSSAATATRGEATAVVRAAEHAAATLALTFLLSLLDEPPVRATLALPVSFGFGLLIALAATRLGGGPWLAVAVVATALVQLGWTMQLHPRVSPLGLVLAAASASVLAWWPLLVARRLRDDRWAWRASALAPLAWFPTVVTLWESWLGDAAIGLPPLALAGLSLAAAARARDLWGEGDPRRTSALAWLCGAALTLATVAIPLQVEKEWITIGWALEGAALLLLWQRLDHAGLKYVALALLAAAAARLVANPEVLAYHPRAGWRVVNWLAYAYLVPAAALAYSSRLLSAFELDRLREWERSTYDAARGRPVGALFAGAAALVVTFVWINLCIADWYAVGGELELMVARTPAQKLTTSIAWALYAIGLLALGVRRRSSGLRWASLALLMATIGKIFLYDLGELRDLYRVAALLGLAVSLIAVSLVYQRFLFRRVETEGGKA